MQRLGEVIRLRRAAWHLARARQANRLERTPRPDARQGESACKKPTFSSARSRYLSSISMAPLSICRRASRAAVTPFLQSKGWSGEANSFVTWWRRTHFENSMIDALCDRGHTPYRQIGHRAVSYVMDRCGIAYTPEEVRWLVSQIELLQPFPDVIAGLRKAARRRLQAGDPVERRSRYAQSCRSPHRLCVRPCHLGARGRRFKPHWKTYAKAEEIIGEDRSSTLFVANHAFDCIGAKSFGMRTAFIDRRQRPFGETAHQPDLIVSNFSELAAVLA